MVFAGPAADTPEGVAPGVAFDELRVSGGDQLVAEIWVTRELVADERRHDLELDLLPVRTQRDSSTAAFSKIGCGGVTNRPTALEVVRLGRLECMLDRRIQLALVFDF